MMADLPPATHVGVPRLVPNAEISGQHSICHDCAEYGESVDGDDPQVATRRWDNREVRYWLHREPAWLDLCEGHFFRRDNAEPPEPDGEAFRGNEAAAYQAEQMTAAQRLK